MFFYSGLKSFYGKKARLKNEITKRQHENYILAEDKSQVGVCVFALFCLLPEQTLQNLFMSVVAAV